MTIAGVEILAEHGEFVTIRAGDTPEGVARSAFGPRDIERDYPWVSGPYYSAVDGGSRLDQYDASLLCRVLRSDLERLERTMDPELGEYCP